MLNDTWSECTLFQEKRNPQTCIGMEHGANIHFVPQKENANVFVIKNICCVSLGLKLLSFFSVFILFSVCIGKWKNSKFGHTHYSDFEKLYTTLLHDEILLLPT